MKIVRYTRERKQLWQEFLSRATNATFLHNRDYMEYHSNRFCDCSLMAFDDNMQKLLAVMPANLDGNSLWSHQGLTYGGWLMPQRHFTPALSLELWETASETMRRECIDTLYYKPVPWIYSAYPAEDDIYALWRLGAAQHSVQPAGVIPLHEPLLYDQGTRRNIRKAEKNGIVIEETCRLEPYWRILTSRLQTKYGTLPVHTLEEISLLQSRFPDNIRLFIAHNGNPDEPLGGMLLYVTGRVVHTQYIASTEQGRLLNVLPAVLDCIARRFSASHTYLDLGTSCEDSGHILNKTLASQKYRLGGRTATYVTYKLTL